MSAKRPAGKPLAVRIRHRITARAALLAASLIPRFRLETVQRFGALLGRAALLLGGARKRRTLAHIRIGYPALTSKEKRALLRQTYSAMGQVFMEALWLPAYRSERDDKRIRVEPEELLHACVAKAKERGKGMLVFSGHIGCWELLLPWFVRHSGMPVMVVAAEPKLPELSDALRALRESTGAKVAWRGEAALAVMRHLRAGGVAVLLVDHNLRGEGIEVPFFGKPAHTMLAPARLAIRSGALVTTIVCYREGFGQAVLVPGEPFDTPATMPKDEAARAAAESKLTEDYTARLEELVRRDPGQWLWMHRRWRERN